MLEAAENKNMAENEIATDGSAKENKWTESIAVGSKPFIEIMRETLGLRTKGRKITGANDTFEFREVIAAYGNTDDQMSGNTFL